MDLILGGNMSSDFLPQFGRLDASEGHILLNKGNGAFQYISSAKSGLTARGVTRDIAVVNGKNRKYIIFLENDDYPQIYEIEEQRKQPSSFKMR
ncbi:MAG: hypothetical protein JWM28_2612 [Chitinophagaceae bacterium]|nr:hypothetical protein [Chitinophagaceae bacterium]